MPAHKRNSFVFLLFREIFDDKYNDMYNNYLCEEFIMNVYIIMSEEKNIYFHVDDQKKNVQ